MSIIPFPFAEATPDYLPKNWWEWLVNQGIAVTLLAVAVFFVAKLLLTTQAKLGTLQDTRITELTAEMKEVRKENQQLRDTLAIQQQEINECKEDRAELRQKIDAMK